MGDRDYTVYLIGDHSKPEEMEQKAKELAAEHDYEIINPIRLYDRENPCLVDRIEWLSFEADGVYLLPNALDDLNSLAEVAVAIAENKKFLFDADNDALLEEIYGSGGADCGEQA